MQPYKKLLVEANYFDLELIIGWKVRF